MTLTQIKQTLAQHLPELKEKYPIGRLALFGSYARGEQTAKSDIDIMVEFDKPAGMEYLDLAFELEKLLGSKVDLVSRKAIKPRYFEFLKNDLIYV